MVSWWLASEKGAGATKLEKCKHCLYHQKLYHEEVKDKHYRITPLYVAKMTAYVFKCKMYTIIAFN